MTDTTNDTEMSERQQLLARLDKLYSAVVSDILDEMGYVGTQVMDTRIRPIYREARVIGVAATVQTVNVDGPPEDPEDYYKGEIAAVDALKDGDVSVVSTCNGIYWGELVATASRYRGARGVVLDAGTRDVHHLIEMDFPTFAAIISPEDSLGRIDVVDVGVPVECGGVTVNNGDLVIGDYDGVVVIPKEIADKVLTLAEEKVRDEDLVRAELAAGIPVRDVFKKYGVL